ncbi:MAG: hypothetical protein V2A53_06585 [bacterium]
MTINWQQIEKQMSAIGVMWMKFRTNEGILGDTKKQRLFLTALAEVISRLERRLSDGNEQQYYDLAPQSALEAAKQNPFIGLAMQRRSKEDFLKYLVAVQKVSYSIGHAVDYIISWQGSKSITQDQMNEIDSAITKASKELKSLRSINW